MSKRDHVGRTRRGIVALVACGGVLLAPLPALARSGGVSDPLEGMNRVFFGIHQVLDRFLIRPAAMTYKRVLPKPIRTTLAHMVSNLGEPAVFVNDVLQGHGKEAAITFTRFTTNSIFGLGGVFDIATKNGLPHHPNDFGITLARYGAPPGPYLFIPLVGPMTLRDGVGSAVGLGLDPLVYLRYGGDDAVGATTVISGGLLARADADAELKALYATATDPYASFRSYFLQNRQSQITGGKINLDALPDFGDPDPAPAPSVAPTGLAPSTPDPGDRPTATPLTPGAGGGASRRRTGRSTSSAHGRAASVMTGERGDLVLVTGATGFVGSAVARAAVADGFRTRVLARPASPRRNLQGLEVEVAEGDLSDAASLVAALRGVRYLFHVAADYRLWARHPEEIVRNNRQGVGAIMDAARAAGVERIVYTSSVATLGFHADGRPSDENLPLKEDEAIGAYKRSKVIAERMVEQRVADGLPVVLVNPSTPIGPRDIKPTPTGRIIVEAATGKIPAFVDTGLNLVHVDDVAAGHLLALKQGRIGERYILGGEDVSLRQMLTDIAGLAGRRPPTLNLPRGPLYPLAVVAEAIGQITGKEPMLTRDALKMASHRMFFSSDKARTELGYAARPYREGLADALGWFRAEGYLA